MQTIQRSDWSPPLLCASDCLSVIYESLRHGLKAWIWSHTSTTFYFLGLLRHFRISPGHSGFCREANWDEKHRRSLARDTFSVTDVSAWIGRDNSLFGYVNPAPSCLFLAAFSYFLFCWFFFLSLLQVSTFSLLFQNPLSLLFPRKFTMLILLDYLVYRNITADNSPQMLSGTWSWGQALPKLFTFH